MVWEGRSREAPPYPDGGKGKCESGKAFVSRDAERQRSGALDSLRQIEAIADVADGMNERGLVWGGFDFSS